VDGQEGEAGLRIAAGPNPALDRRWGTDRRPARQDVGDSFSLRHMFSLSFEMTAVLGRDRRSGYSTA